MILTTKEFLAAAQFAVEPISSGHPTLPVLRCLKMVAADGRLTLTGSNLDLAASRSVPCDGDLECCAPAERLVRFLKSCQADELDVVMRGDKLVMETDTQRCTLDTLPADDFPPDTEVTGESIPLPYAEIAAVLPAVSDDTTRYALNGVYIGKGAVTGTDGRRLHAVTGEFAQGNVIVPTAAATMLSKCDGTLQYDQRAFAAAGGDWRIFGKLVEGHFPNWRQVVPSGLKKSAAAPAGFIAAIRRALDCADRDKKVEQSITIGEGKVETPGYSEDIDLKLGFRTTFRGSYIIDALTSAGDGAIINYDDECSPIKITNGDFIGVVMPMRVVL